MNEWIIFVFLLLKFQIDNESYVSQGNNMTFVDMFLKRVFFFYIFVILSF